MTAWSAIVGQFANPPAAVEPTVNPTHKRCRECQRMLPMSEFYERKYADGHTGRISQCRDCYCAHQRHLQAIKREKKRRTDN